MSMYMIKARDQRAEEREGSKKERIKTISIKLLLFGFSPENKASLWAQVMYFPIATDSPFSSPSGCLEHLHCLS